MGHAHPDDKAVLIINVASKSEKTDEYYKALAGLSYKFGGQGFEIIAVPCSQFGDEPGGPVRTNDLK